MKNKMIPSEKERKFFLFGFFKDDTPLEKPKKPKKIKPIRKKGKKKTPGDFREFYY